MSELISLGEMEELTGAKTPSKQVEVLRKNGIRFTIRADGRPSLTWEAYNRQVSTPETMIGADNIFQMPNMKAI